MNFHLKPNNNKIFHLCLMYKIPLVSEYGRYINYQILSFLHSNSYFLTGIMTDFDPSNSRKYLIFLDINYYVPIIRGILNKHVRTFVSLYRYQL